jgi:hypothetical protein
MLAYYLLFILFVCFAILDDNLTAKSKHQILIISGAILVLFAGLRGTNVDADYSSYLNKFNNTPSISSLFTSPALFFSKMKVEPSMVIIFSFIKSIFRSGFPLAIFIYAFFSVTLKLRAISKMTDYVMLSTLIYFSGIFLLQDMTQIRAGFATGFLLLSIPYILQQDFKKFSIYILIAICFHYSAIIFAPFYFFNTKKVNKPLYFSILIIPIILALLKFTPFNILNQFNLGIYSEKINLYLIGQAWERRSINIFNFSILFQIAVSIFFILFSEKANNKYAVLLTKINCFGVAMFYIFSSSPVLAFRLSDILGIVQILLVPYMIHIIKPKALAESVVILISIAYLLNQTLINPILKPYTFIFN